jgi:hypothetical protein
MVDDSFTVMCSLEALVKTCEQAASAATKTELLFTPAPVLPPVTVTYRKGPAVPVTVFVSQLGTAARLQAPAAGTEPLMVVVPSPVVVVAMIFAP